MGNTGTGASTTLDSNTGPIKFATSQVCANKLTKISDNGCKAMLEWISKIPRYHWGGGEFKLEMTPIYGIYGIAGDVQLCSGDIVVPG
jgi:hypothetical protein